MDDWVCFGMFFCILYSHCNIELQVRMFLNVMSLSIVVLSYIIYKDEAVYWYTGISYSQAIEAGSERRRGYAKAHMIVFVKFALFMILFSTLMQIFELSIVWDIIVCPVGIITVAISTIKIKL